MSDPSDESRVESRASIAFRLTPPKTQSGFAFDAPVRDDTRVQFYGFPGGQDSYANVSRAVASALVRAFGDVSVCDYAGGHLAETPLAPNEGLNRRAHAGVFLGFPTHTPEGFFRHPVTVGLFACEADRILPTWVRACNRFDLVCVPSTFCRDAFVDSGVTVPVMVVPHGVSPVFAPNPDVRERDHFVFFNSFRHRVAGRKGYAELLRCFRAAFEGRDDVRLRLAVTDYRWLSPPDAAIAAQVEFVPTGGLDEATVARRYAAAHCTVHPSMGEGFGLVPLESIACATPVIAPAHTGLADYLDDDNAMILNAGNVLRAPRVDHFCGHMRGIDEDHLVDRLRHAAAHWEVEHERVGAASASIRSRYSWERALAPFLARVDTALRCRDRRAFADACRDLVDRAAIRAAREAARRRAASRTERAAPEAEPPAFTSIVYCGWDNPRDSIGRHLRLLDGLVFDSPAIRYKSLDELPSAFDAKVRQPVAPDVHEQRPDLFQGGLYLDVVGLHPSRKAIDRQLERIARVRQQLDAKVAMYLMWESDRLWAPMWPLLRACDLVIVTTNLLREDLERHGVPFAVLPHPYEYVVDRPAGDTDPSREPLVIGSSAGFWPRKNLDVLAKAFADVHGENPGMRLKLHCRYEPADDDQRRVNAAIREAMARAPNIELRVDRMDRAAYLDWLRSVDVYAYLSSGEGWSVTPREALHLGKPVVLLDAHAHAGFSHLPGVIRISPGTPRAARHGLASIDGEVGFEAGVNTAAVIEALANIRSLAGDARRELTGRLGEVIAHHDIGAIRWQWHRALSRLRPPTR